MDSDLHYLQLPIRTMIGIKKNCMRSYFESLDKMWDTNKNYHVISIICKGSVVLSFVVQTDSDQHGWKMAESFES